ncbi:hypothetical protein GF322_04210 [Candidatus Dependentiae bacterium]|nr:hypothetical protein [Candidatus Dependentiae bacterium]
MINLNNLKRRFWIFIFGQLMIVYNLNSCITCTELIFYKILNSYPNNNDSIEFNKDLIILFKNNFDKKFQKILNIFQNINCTQYSNVLSENDMQSFKTVFNKINIKRVSNLFFIDKVFGDIKQNNEKKVNDCSCLRNKYIDFLAFFVRNEFNYIRRCLYNKGTAKNRFQYINFENDILPRFNKFRYMFYKLNTFQTEDNQIRNKHIKSMQKELDKIKIKINKIIVDKKFYRSHRSLLAAWWKFVYYFLFLELNYLT